MFNLSRPDVHDLVVGFQYLHLGDPLRVQKTRQSIVMAINDLSSQLKLHVQASPLDLLPVYQVISQLLSTPLVQEFSDIVQALDDFLGPQKDMLDTAARVSSSACSAMISPKSLLESLAAASRCCRHKQAYASEYLIRKLFVAAICLHPAASKEEMQRAIELEMEHLDCVSLFKDVPGSDQKKYDQHLENYLQLLSKFFDFDIVSTEIEDTFSEIVENLETLLGEEGVNPVLLRRHLAFLHSRPEWFFYKTGPLAKCLLLEVQEIAGKEAVERGAKDQAELELILLEADQATKYEGASKAFLQPLLTRIISLLPTLSPSDSIVALSVGVRIYEVLAKQSNQPENIVKQMLVALQKAIQIGNKNKEKLDFRALQALAQCRFHFGFYASLCFKDADQLKSGCEALLGVSQEFWASEKTRKAAAFLSDCLHAFKDFPTITLMIEGKFSLLEKLKLMLTRDIYHLANIYLSSGPNLKCSFDIDMVPENKEDVFKDESIVWAACKQKFASHFFSGNFRAAEDIIKWYFLCHYFKAQKTLIEQRYIVNECVNIGQFFTVVVSESKGGDIVSCHLDAEKIADFSSKEKDFPLLQHIWISHLSRFLGDTDCVVQLGTGQRIENITLPGVAIFSQMYHHVIDQLRDFQGKLAYTEVIQDTMRAYVNNIIGSSFIGDVFTLNLRDLVSSEPSQIIKFRRHAPSMESLSKLCINAYLFLDCHMPDPHDKNWNSLFERARDSAMIGLIISESQQEKSSWSQIGIQLAEHKFRSLKSRASVDKVQEAYVELLHAKLVHISQVEDSDEKLDLLEDLFADFPHSEEDIEKRIWPDGYEKSELVCKYLFSLKVFRCMHLIATQLVDAGITLFNKLISTQKSFKPLQKLDGTMSFQVQLKAESKFIPHPENLIRDQTIGHFSAPIWKMRSNKRQAHPQKPLVSSQEMSLPPPQNTQPVCQAIEEPFSYQEQSEKKEVLDRARLILQNQELKKQKKQARATSKEHMDTAAAMSAQVTTSSSVVANSSANSQVVKKGISKKAKAIFDRLWQEKVPGNGPWKMRSFRNDIKMTRTQAHKLITALGYSYCSERWNGGHLILHLPKIEFNGKDVGGLIDLERGQLIITLTGDEELKHYQIRQLRNILLEQGFTPDTVVVKDQ